MNSIAVTSEMVIFGPLHCKLDNTRSRQTSKISQHTCNFIPHTEHVSLVQFNLCRVNVQRLYEATPHGTRPSHFQGEIAGFP